MTISFIVAKGRADGAIGRGNELPWRLRDDMRLFRRHTLDKPIVMGRRTWESIGQRPLPRRAHVVVSRQRLSLPDGVALASSPQEGLRRAREIAPDAEEIMVIGGATLYEQLLARADRVYLTEVDVDGVDGADAFFVELRPDQWREVPGSRQAFTRDERNEHPFTFRILERIKPPPAP